MPANAISQSTSPQFAKPQLSTLPSAFQDQKIPNPEGSSLKRKLSSISASTATTGGMSSVSSSQSLFEPRSPAALNSKPSLKRIESVQPVLVSSAEASDNQIFKQIVADMRSKFENFVRENPSKRFVVTLDGPPGSGKESVACGLAEALGELAGTFRLDVDKFLYSRMDRQSIAREEGFSTNKFCTGDELRFGLLQDTVDQLSGENLDKTIFFDGYTRDPSNKKIDGTLQPQRVFVAGENRILFVDGSHSSKLKMVNHRVFLMISPDRNKEMRLARDMRSRSTGDLATLRHEADSAVKQSQDHIMPSAKSADALLKWGEERNINGRFSLEFADGFQKN